MKAFIFQSNSRNSRSNKYSSNRSQYAGKVKCYTLKSVQTSPNSAGNRLMLGLKDPKVDSYCEYEQRSVVTKQKRLRTEFPERDNRGNACSKPRRSVDPQSTITVQDRDFMREACGIMMPSDSIVAAQGQDFKSEKESNKTKEKENSVTLYSSEPNEENSKAFMESIGSWINDLFTVPNKRLCTAPKSDKEEVQKSLVLEEDTEYLKSINAIKEQFRKKLKSETSVHLSSADKPFEFHFDKVLENNRKPKKRVRSTPSTKYSELLEELNGLSACESLDHLASDKMTRGNNLNPTGAGLYIRKNEKETAPQPVNSSLILSSSNLVKKKRKISHRYRSDISKLEEYVLPSPAELSKRILLNINDQEKCLQFYKNPHLGVQEAQHYAARKTKPCQSNMRCYTTNANGTDSSEDSRSKAFMTINRHSHCFTGDAPEIKGEEDILSNKSPLDFKKPSFRKAPVKYISELSRDTLSFAKMKAGKSTLHPQIESLKNDSKATSDELVKYLMKKIKVSGRPQHTRKKGTNIPQVLGNPKSRFMQSATNSLVMSVIAKKENDIQGVAKTRMLTDKLMKSSFPSKELIVKYPDGNIRFDVSRALNYNKFNKSTYLLEEDKLEEDFDMLGKNTYRSTRRPYEDLLKKDLKKSSDKITKRQEVKHMLSKIDMKFVLNSPKLKQKELKKKAVKTMLDNLDVDENKDSPNPRFLRQHELFKNNTKAAKHTAEPISEADEKQPDPPTPNSLSTELALVNTDVQLTLANLKEKNVVVSEQPEDTASNSTPEDNQITDLLCIEENAGDTKTERKSPVKPSLYREKFHKNKSQNLLKENESKNLLNPLPEYYSSEIPNQKEATKQCEPGLCPPELRPLKSMDTLLFNRRYSTNTLTETIRKGKHNLRLSGFQPRKCTLSLTNLGKDSEGEKKEAKEKQKVKPPKSQEMQDKDVDTNCGFERIKKKPGPNCEADEVSKP